MIAVQVAMSKLNRSSSIDLMPCSLTKEDYTIGSGGQLGCRLHKIPEGQWSLFEVTVEDAKAYAEAILEGGEDRF